eukprot:g57645.t1
MQNRLDRRTRAQHRHPSPGPTAADLSGSGSDTDEAERHAAAKNHTYCGGVDVQWRDPRQPLDHGAE